MRLQFSADSHAPVPQDQCTDGLRGEGLFLSQALSYFPNAPWTCIPFLNEKRGDNCCCLTRASFLPISSEDDIRASPPSGHDRSATTLLQARAELARIALNSVLRSGGRPPRGLKPPQGPFSPPGQHVRPEGLSYFGLRPRLPQLRAFARAVPLPGTLFPETSAQLPQSMFRVLLETSKSSGQTCGNCYHLAWKMGPVCPLQSRLQASPSPLPGHSLACSLHGRPRAPPPGSLP